MKTPVNRSVRYLSFVILLAAPFSLLPSAALADGPAKAPASAAVKPADTSEEHLAKAAEYAKKATGYRAEAAVHQKMLAEYRGQAVSEGDSGNDRKAMQVHCEGYFKKAEALAIEAEKFSDYHRMRAAELKGK